MRREDASLTLAVGKIPIRARSLPPARSMSRW